MVMRVGVWKPNPTRFLFYVPKFRCRGTICARVKDCFRVDRHVLQVRMNAFVENVVGWYAERVVTLIDESHGNFFVGGLGQEVLDKIQTKVDTPLRTHAGMVDGAFV